MPVDLRQISFYPAKRQYILNDSEPGLEIIQSGSGNYLVARPTGGGSPVFQINNAGVISSAAGTAEFSTVQSTSGANLSLNAQGAGQDLLLKLNATTRIILDGATSRVGIGTGITTPTGQLEVISAESATIPALVVQNSYNAVSNLVAVFSGFQSYYCC